MAARYLDIAAQLRDRIAAGRLRPGDHVPSARQISREWGVAIATATRVLSTLQAEGLVRPVVGVGTLVARRGTDDTPLRTDAPDLRTTRRAARERPAELSRDHIVRTAVAIADAEGLTAVTMRRLATELDVAVMSLYRHVPAKEDLVVLMVDHVLGEEPLPESVSAGWRARVEAIARLQWRLVKRHVWVGSVMSLTRPLMPANGMAQTDACMAALREQGLGAAQAMQVVLALAGLLSGVGASLQAEVETERETGLTQSDWVEGQEEAFLRLDVGHRFPNLAAVDDPPDLDEVFELGLSLLLDGLAQRLTTGTAHRR
jgi:DNA-binding transcriptional regulator YhcF (GntR family)